MFRIQAVYKDGHLLVFRQQMPRTSHTAGARNAAPAPKTRISKRNRTHTVNEPTPTELTWTVLRTGRGWVPCPEINARSWDAARLLPGKQLVLKDTDKDRLVLKCDREGRFGLVVYEKGPSQLELKRASLVKREMRVP